MNDTINKLLDSQELKNRIKSISNKFYNVEKNDLYQAGYIGVMKALKNYNINSGVQFYTFAYKYIFGEMYELAKNNRNIKLNKNYLKLYKQIESAKTLLTQKFNREPSYQEISNYLEIELSLINDVVITCKKIISLDEESELLSDSNLYAITGSSYDYDTKILVSDSLEELDEMERKVINMRYFNDYTQQEIANILGINQVKVSRLESKGKRKIKEYINA